MLVDIRAQKQCDGSERRFFAGLYLLFRFSYHFFSCPVFPLLIVSFQVGLSFIMAAMIAILRPYKTIAHNVANFMSVFFLLVYASTGFATVLTTYNFAYNFAYNFIFLVSHVLECFLYVPLLILCFYLSYRLFKPCCARVTICKNTKKWKSNKPSLEYQAPLISDVSVTTVTLNDFVADEQCADRILNPDEYKEHVDGQ